MGCLRGLDSKVAEVKQIYVRERFRGAKLGALLFERLLNDASQFGYKCIRLESAPFMTTAHRIYEAAGFVDRLPYDDAEVPEEFHTNWRFMERELNVIH